MGTYGKISLILATLFLSSIAYSQQYVINAYVGESIPKAIATIFVNLDSKQIVNEIITGDLGQIINTKALPILRDSDTLIIAATMEGCYCDNSIVGKNMAKISIFDPRTNAIIYSYADSNLFIDAMEKQPGALIYLSAETLSEPVQSLNGDYLLDSRFKFLPHLQREENYSYGLYDSLGPFGYLKPVNIESGLYRGSYLSRYYIIKTRIDRGRIIDTLYLNNTPYRTHLIALKDSIIYDFNLNWEIHTEYSQKDYGENWINSHVKLFNLSNFGLINTIPLVDYSPGNYPDGVFDKADVVGPYIVYYFFGREGLMKYAPAMLFIFDTRTNEATWLRVGWR